VFVNEMYITNLRKGKGEGGVQKGWLKAEERRTFRLCNGGIKIKFLILCSFSLSEIKLTNEI
jgi:hypothetical protein